MPRYTNQFRHTDTGTYAAEASDLGLAPGRFPETFEVEFDGKTYCAAARTLHFDGERELTHASYRAPGYRFIIWND